MDVWFQQESRNTDFNTAMHNFKIYPCSIELKNYFSFEYFLNFSGLGSLIACSLISLQETTHMSNPAQYIIQFGFLGLVCPLS